MVKNNHSLYTNENNKFFIFTIILYFFIKLLFINNEFGSDLLQKISSIVFIISVVSLLLVFLFHRRIMIESKGISIIILLFDFLFVLLFHYALPKFEDGFTFFSSEFIFLFIQTILSLTIILCTGFYSREMSKK